ncbi:MAG TPA: 1,2-phenylacetyl-CoA epoxidase subunit PaaC [Acidimicrobiia bacterium]|nr:1,2-phenylacetyl-CoA epoxidase subunit PaaC [Acidimicrobiia bacterium]
MEPNPPSLPPIVPSANGDRLDFLLACADDNLVLAQRLGEWISNAPELEEDIALGNIALDHLGVARALYTHAGEVESLGRTEDDLAMRRSERDFMNALLVEQPNGDFAHTMVRSLFFDAYQVELWSDFSDSDDATLAGIAARALKEARYHLRHSSAWVIRLGDGTEESHPRAQDAVDALWRFTAELFEGGADGYRDRWQKTIEGVLDEARLTIPEDPYQRSGGRRGFHSEHLGHLLAEMQWMQRSYPGLKW